MPAPAQPSTTPALFAAVQRHFHEVVLPLWQGPGWNTELGLPYEALDRQQLPLPPQRYRAMACARQLYLFASLIGTVNGAETRAATLFDSLNRHFHDAKHGGWFYSIDPQGAPLDSTKDLYTHAFVIFACAHYFAKAARPEVAATLDEALAVVAEQFASGDGLYEASLAADGSSLGSGPLQNPLMHLAEAFLATLEFRHSPTVEKALLDLATAMQARFVDPHFGVLLEKPFGAVDNWYEPGHQFEWLYLLATSPLLRDGELHRSLANAFTIAQAQGVDKTTGAVQAMLQPDGQPRDGAQRIWAQAEYLRALTLQPDARIRVPAQLEALQRDFLAEDGWYESRDADGVLNRQDMPSTTPYHLATCYAGLVVLGGDLV